MAEAVLPDELRPFPRRADEARAELVLEGLWQLVLPLAYTRNGTVNCYLIQQAAGWCLVDCGTSLAPGWDALERAIALAGVDLRAIALLVCTHAHPDHYGLAADLVDAVGCELALAPGPLAVADIMRDPIVPLERRRSMALRAGVPADLLEAAVLPPSDDTHYRRPEPDRLLREGAVIEALGASWQIVPAPGHSPTQIVLVEERRGTVLSADLVLAGRIPYLEYEYTPDPWAEHVDALRRVGDLRPELLLPGHGEPLTQPGAAIAASLSAAEAAPARVLDALVARPRSAYDVVLDVLGADAPFYVRFMALAGVLTMLGRLEKQGTVVSTVESDQVQRFARFTNRTVV